MLQQPQKPNTMVHDAVVSNQTIPMSAKIAHVGQLYDVIIRSPLRRGIHITGQLMKDVTGYYIRPTKVEGIKTSRMIQFPRRIDVQVIAR